MPAPLRSAGCLPVVASLLPPGTRLTALRPSGPQNCRGVARHLGLLPFRPSASEPFHKCFAFFASAEGFHPFNPRRFAAAPRGMPAPLRSAGCLPVVASLLPPGTRLTALRPSGPQNCRGVARHLGLLPVWPRPPNCSAVALLFFASASGVIGYGMIYTPAGRCRWRA